MEDKKHWYDGLFYDRFVAPHQDLIFRMFKTQIAKDSTLLDVGCGTGRLEFQLANHCREVVGLDLSSLNIKYANKHLKEFGNKNVGFIHGSILKIDELTDKHFDYALTSYVLHEMSPQMRIDSLKKMREIADKIIVGDYRVPMPKGFWSVSVKMVEFSAGPDHFNNFRHFIRSGGIENLAKEAGLKITKKISAKLPYAEIAILE